MAAASLAVLLGFAGLVVAAEGDQPAPPPPPQPPPKLKIYGDVRLRAESDWDSLQSDGTERADRDRLRVRGRIGFNYAYDEHISFGARLRTGNPQDQQSPHQTLGDEFETKGVNFDRAFVQGTWKSGWVWGGKNVFPFWTQNELFWDEDVTPEGVAGGLIFKLGESAVRLKPAAAYFFMENSGSNNTWSDKAYVTAAQLALEAPLSKVDFSGAVGFYSFNDNPAPPDIALADMDYAIWVAGARAVFKTARPLGIGVDYMRNVEDYAPTVFNGDQDTGYVFQVSLGQLKQRKDWLIGYYYAHIEKFAVVARLAQDDWLRWGSAIPPDTRSSNFEGHEFRIAYAFGTSWNVMLRVYDVEGIELESPTAVTLEDGMRARLDFNIAF